MYTTYEHLPLTRVMQEQFEPVYPGDRWGKEWEYGWFRTKVRLGKWACGKRIVVDLNLGGEATLFVNNEVFGTRRDDWVHQKHHMICDNYLTRCSSGEEEFELVAECYGGHARPDVIGDCASGPSILGKTWERPDNGQLRCVLGKSTVGIWEEELYHLYLEMQALYDIWRSTDSNSLRAAKLEEGLYRAVMSLDFEQDIDTVRDSAGRVREILKPYLLCHNGSSAPQFHMIGHAHIDLAWLWPLEETERKCARTMAAQIRHMEEYPDYKMLLSQPFLYELLEKHYPELYLKIADKIEKGQIIPEGGMWVEADVNLPSGESLIRQFLYGKRYFQEKFGIESTLLWLPDVFGYPASLPQIMKKCGILHFTTHKIFWTYNGGDPFPYHYFQWKGLDGTRTPSFIHVEYSSATDADTLIRRWNCRAQKNGLERMLQPFGYGDGGGGASRDHIENCILFNDMEGVPKVQFDHPNHFFEQIAEDHYAENEYVGELYFQAHRGTYTSQAKTKKGNRRAETALREAEFWCSAASVRGAEYPAEKLEQLWKKLLLNQFHDILPGSSIHRVYERAEQELGEVVLQSRKLAQQALDKLVRKQNGITVFNSLSWDRDVLIELKNGWKGAETTKGVPLPLQKTPEGIAVFLRIPACGSVSLVETEKNESIEVKHRRGVKAGYDENGCVFMENSVMYVLFNKKGELVQIYDKQGQREWTRGICNQFCLYQDIPSHFEAWDIESLSLEKSLDCDEDAALTVLEQGPLFAAVRIERAIHSSKLKQTVVLRQDETMVTFDTKILWKEQHKLLKVAFRPDILSEELISEIQYGHIKRPNHKSRNYDKDRFEVCNHRWSALAEAGRGFAVLNDCKYGISCRGNCMELTLLKAPTYPDETADLGEQEFCYAFCFWNTPMAEADVIRRGYELNTEVMAAEGIRDDESWMTTGAENIILDTVKQAEGGKGLILRLYESKGKTTSSFLQLSLKDMAGYEVAFLTDMLERTEQEILIRNGRLYLDFGPFEVKTVLIKKEKRNERNRTGKLPET